LHKHGRYALAPDKRVFVHFRTETLRTKLEPVHFRSGIESRVFFSGKKKVNHYENESMLFSPKFLSLSKLKKYIHTMMLCSNRKRKRNRNDALSIELDKQSKKEVRA
jgi:hypothetical protein